MTSVVKQKVAVVREFPSNDSEFGRLSILTLCGSSYVGRAKDMYSFFSMTCEDYEDIAIDGFCLRYGIILLIMGWPI